MEHWGWGALPPSFIRGDFLGGEDVFNRHILMEDYVEGLRGRSCSRRANGPAARAMGMARCFLAELHRESEDMRPGLREDVPSCQGSWDKRGERETRQSNGWHPSRGQGSMAAGQGNHLGALYKE